MSSGHRQSEIIPFASDSSLCGGKIQSGAVQAAALAQDALQREVETLQVSAHQAGTVQQLRDQQGSAASGQWQSG